MADATLAEADSARAAAMGFYAAEVGRSDGTEARYGFRVVEQTVQSEKRDRRHPAARPSVRQRRDLGA